MFERGVRAWCSSAKRETIFFLVQLLIIVTRNNTGVFTFSRLRTDTTLEHRYDSTRPTITVTSTHGVSGFTSNDDTISLTFDLSESVSDFTVDDVTVSGGGTLSDFNQDSVVTVYTATLTPDRSDGVRGVRARSARISIINCHIFMFQEYHSHCSLMS